MGPKKDKGKKDVKKDAKSTKGDKSVKDKSDKGSKPATDTNVSSAKASLDPALIPFEAGSIFSKYDKDGDGKLDKHEFTNLIKQHPDLLNYARPNLGSNFYPTEIISNKVLTHFDETTGVALSRGEVEQHRHLGNTVTLLTDAYQSRYERLRLLLTGKLLPKREHLLQLRRQLTNTSSDIEEKRRNIERETLTDTEQIIERLKSVESMRQGTIKHQVLKIEEELQNIERLVRRVEQANIEEGKTQPTTGVLLTSASPGSIPAETVRTPKALSMVELIHQFSDLFENIEKLSSKPVTVQVDFPTDDFPKETSERLEVIARCDRYLHAVNVKDHMLWTSLKEQEKIQEELQEERRISFEYAKEVTNWAEVAQELTKQLLAQKKLNDDLAKENRDLFGILQDHNIYYAARNKNHNLNYAATDRENTMQSQANGARQLL